jgi:hypothetical protein
MANVTKTPEKKRIRVALVNAALATLEKEGWKVARVRGGGKGRVRRITKGSKSLLAAIRTSQDEYIAFPRTEDDSEWATLADVDVVVCAAVDDARNPKVAQVHMFEAADLRQRFDRAYAARLKAGHSIPKGRGVWVSLYHEEGTDPVGRVGAGIGLAHPPIARIPLNAVEAPNAGSSVAPPAQPPSWGAAAADDDDDEPLTIAQAKTRLARTLGVDPGSIKITVEA